MAFHISTLPKRKFRHGGAALLFAKAQHPDAIWGSWHQGPNGRVRIVGKRGEASDPVIVEEKRS